MPRSSIGQAKNTVRRALRAVMDREPNEKDIVRLWAHFQSACAYCATTLVRTERKGHADHLAHDGPNHISNRVLACWKCNGDEKRDMDWVAFLKKKAPDEAGFNERQQRIQAWGKANAPQIPLPAKSDIVEREIETIMVAIDAAANRLRAIRESSRCT